MLINEEWEEFYSQYREEEEPDEELDNLLDSLSNCRKDSSENVCVVLPYSQWQDILDYLKAMHAPSPNYVMMSPMHADPKEMDNTLETK